MKKYVKADNDKFNQFIDKKYKQFEIPKKKRTFNEICFPKKYELQIPQKFLSHYINPDTPYTGVLVYYGIGAGKTCTAIRICENFRGKNKIFVVLPASLENNFRDELRSECVDNSFLTKNEKKKLQTLDIKSQEYNDIIESSNNKIDKVYNIYSYNKFIKLISQNRLNLNNSLVVIDEVHNLISNTGSSYDILYEKIHNSNNLKLVIMTATPIFDKPNEIALTMNLLLKDKQLPIGKDFNKMFLEREIDNNGDIIYSAKNLDIFRQYVKGYISYYKGAPSYVYPSKNSKIVNVKMSDHQLKNYIKIIKDAKIETTDIVNSFLIASRMTSNISYPNGKVSEKGFASMRNNSYDLEKIKIYAPKFIAILKNIKKSFSSKGESDKNNGPAFVYSSFKKYGGVYDFANFLKHMGYKDYQEYGPGKKRFAIWSGDQDNLDKNEIKNVVNNYQNKNGELIKIIIGSPSIKEGVSLKRFSQVHIMEPYWNISRLLQIEGRAIRYCSHRDLEKEKQHVDVFIYVATHPTIKMTVDQHIVDLADKKENIKSEFLRALQESAIDCRLFKEHQEKGEKVNCIN